EDGAGRMTDVPDARLGGDVTKLASTNVLEQPVPVTDRGDEEVGVTVVVDVGEGTGDADRVRHAEVRAIGDVLVAAAPRVAPQLAAAQLGDEVQVGTSVAIDIGAADSRPVIVMILLIGLPRVIDAAVHERDAARLAPVRELESMIHGRVGGQLELLIG